jgi:hypothetical protein
MLAGKCAGELFVTSLLVINDKAFSPSAKLHCRNEAIHKRNVIARRNDCKVIHPKERHCEERSNPPVKECIFYYINLYFPFQSMRLLREALAMTIRKVGSSFVIVIGNYFLSLLSLRRGRNDCKVIHQRNVIARNEAIPLLKNAFFTT